jgi:hypothetical protein
MTDLNALKEQRDALEAELAELEANLPGLRHAVETAPTDWNYLAHPIWSPEATAAREALSAAEVRIQILAGGSRSLGEIGRLEEQIAHIEAVACADEQISKTAKEKQEAAARCARLSASLERIARQLESIRAEHAQASEAAQVAEREAAQAIAKATASGDTKASNAAQAQMKKAIDDARAVSTAQDTNKALVSALEAEAAALEKQLVTAQREEDAAHRAWQSASATKLGNEWDQVVDTLAAIGARLVSEGGVQYELRDLNLPMFAPDRKRVDFDSLKELARGQAA